MRLGQRFDGGGKGVNQGDAGARRGVGRGSDRGTSQSEGPEDRGHLVA